MHHDLPADTIPAPYIPESDTTRPPLTSLKEKYTSVLATELLEVTTLGHLTHPLIGPRRLSTQRSHGITHAILDLTGFLISRVRQAHGLPLPTPHDTVIAATFVAAAKLAFELVGKNSDAEDSLPPHTLYKNWIISTARLAVPSARLLLENTIPSPTTSEKKPTAVSANEFVISFSFA